MYLHPYRLLLLGRLMAPLPQSMRRPLDLRQHLVLYHNPLLAQHQLLGNQTHLGQRFLVAVPLATLVETVLVHLVMEMLSDKRKHQHPVSRRSLHLVQHLVRPQSLHLDLLLRLDKYRNRHLVRRKRRWLARTRRLDSLANRAQL